MFVVYKIYNDCVVIGLSGYVYLWLLLLRRFELKREIFICLICRMIILFVGLWKEL